MTWNVNPGTVGGFFGEEPMCPHSFHLGAVGLDPGVVGPYFLFLYLFSISFNE